MDISNINDIFFGTIIVSKDFFLNFSNNPQFVFIFLNIFNFNVHNVPYVIIGVFQHCIQCLNAPLRSKKKKNHIQPMPLMFPACLFNTLLLFIVIFSFFVVSHFSLSLMLFKCVFILE